MQRKSPVRDAIRVWIAKQDPGTILTPTIVSQRMGAEGIHASSGAAHMALQELKQEARVTSHNGSLGPGATRGFYKVLPRVVIPAQPGSPIVRPLLQSSTAKTIPDAVKRSIEAIHKIQDGLDELAASILMPYSPQKEEASA